MGLGVGGRGISIRLVIRCREATLADYVTETRKRTSPVSENLSRGGKWHVRPLSGRMPIAIPAGVTVTIAENNKVTVKGR